MTGPALRRARLATIDLLRGSAVVIMALDHVRDLLMINGALDPMQDPAAGPGLFATRWVTHFCAPVFVILAGVSVGLLRERLAPADLTRRLVVRGVWLVVVDWFVVSTAVTFAPFGDGHLGGSILVLLQVLWVIGLGMIVLAGAHGFGARVCLWVGAVILLGHNALDMVWPTSGPLEEGHPFWWALHAQMSLRLGPFLVVLVYPILPWLGLMLTGYGAASIFQRPAADRDRVLLRIGVAMTMAFLIGRALNAYGDPRPWHLQATLAAGIMDFLNTAKYPPSLLFLLMTLGPAAIVASAAHRIHPVPARVLTTFGQVPFAFYIVHFFLIHAIGVALAIAQGLPPSAVLTHPLFFPKDAYGLPLSGVLTAWVLVVAVLYPLCRWFAALKARRQDWWLSYL